MHNTFQSTDTPTMFLSSWGFGILLLLLIALVLGASTVISHRKLSWSAALTQGLGSLLWASPVIAVLAFVAVKVFPHFQFGSETQQTANADPSWLKTDADIPVKVEDVVSFTDEPDDATINLEGRGEDSLPSWTTDRVQRLQSSKGKPEQEVWRVTLESGDDYKDWKLTEAEARESLAAKAAELVQEDFRRFYPGEAELPADEVQSRAMRTVLVTHRLFDKNSDPFPGYKVYGQVELSPNVRKQLFETWKQELATKRAWLMGGVLAFLSLIAGSFAAYFKLDTRSNGAHRFRLKLAATALMTAGGLGLLANLPLL